MLRDLLAAVLVGAVLAGVLAVFAWRSDREATGHLDDLVLELGTAVAETAAGSLTTSLAASKALEQEIRESLRVKSGFLSRADATPELLHRFAVATELRHVILFDEAGQVVAHARDIPRAVEGSSAGQLELSLELAARRLLAELKVDPIAREWEVPEAGLGPSLVLVRRLGSGGAAVLVQTADPFARSRAAGGPDRLAARLEEVGRIAYLRFNQDPPNVDPARVLALTTPVGDAGVLQVGIDRGPALRARSVSRRNALVSGAAMALVAAVAAWGLFRLRRSRDDLQRRIAHEERLTSLGRLAANIAHEVRNPLNAISIAAQRLERGEEDVPALARVIHEETGRLDRTVSDVLAAARPRAPQYGTIESEELLATVSALAKPEAETRRIELTLDADSFSFEGDADLLAGAAWNLLRNAFAVSTEVELHIRNGGKSVAITVRDRGPGIPEAVRERIFEPFASGRPGGAGLGLPLALSAAEAHGGTIVARDRTGGGTEFRIELPRERGG